MRKKIVFNEERLKELRIGNDLSKAQLAILIDCSELSVHLWEEEGREPAPKNVKKLADLFNVPITSFYKEVEVVVKKAIKKKLDGNKLRTIREAYGYSQAQLAERMGLSANSGVFTICKWEKETIGCRQSNVQKLADLFGCQEDELYKEVEEEER